MNYYEHHINDYAEATSHLTFAEDAAYSRCLRKYYAKEAPLPADVKAVQRLIGCRTPEDRAAVETVLREFFVLMPDGWHQEKCDEVIAAYQAGEPERAERRQSRQQNHETRLHRHRDERAKLFAALEAAGHRPPWNTKMTTLRQLFAAYSGSRRDAPETKAATAPDTQPETPDTRPATATDTPATHLERPCNAPRTASHSPLPNNQYPGVAGQDSDPLSVTQSGAVLLTSPATPETRRAADFTQSEQPRGAITPPANGEGPRAPATPPETPETFQVEPDPLQYKPGPNPLPAGAMAAALRNARVQTTSDDPTLLAWIRDGITTEQLLEAVDVAKLRKPREVIPANYLDPIVRQQRAKAGAPAKPKQETPTEREWRVLRAEAARDGFHRSPGASETPDQYRAALKQHQRDAASRAAQRLADLGGALKAVPK